MLYNIDYISYIINTYITYNMHMLITQKYMYYYIEKALCLVFDWLFVQ